jgi:hypothetical protein
MPEITQDFWLQADKGVVIVYLNKIFTALLLITTAFIFTSSVLGASDSELEEKIADLMKRDNNQRRSSLTSNVILARIARERAYDMGKRNYYDHVNPDGIGPNYLVTHAGYDLPDFYGNLKSSNNIESIAAGSETAEDVWNSWMHSTPHRTHILGLNDFYAEQVEYGIGHAFVADSKYQHYWVIITAKPRQRGVSEETSGQTTVLSGDDACYGTATAYPDVIKAPDGNLRPVCGYVWVDSSDSKDYRVKFMPGLTRNEKGNLVPAEGYKWVNRADPKDYRVEPVH